jgi:predicted ABC-type ATPase
MSARPAEPAPQAARLLVVTGPPGAGKSTVARLLALDFEPSALVAGDEFFAFLERGAIAPWLPQAQDQNEVVLQAAASAAGRFATGGYVVVYDGVLGPWSLPTFTTAAQLSYVDYVMLLPSQQRCLDRVAARVGHGFTDPEATRHMHRQFATAGVEDRHVLMDPPDDPAATVALIRERLNGPTLRYVTPG